MTEGANVKHADIAAIVARWDDPSRRPLFKGRLIDDDNCMCAQGDILHVECGWSFERLKAVSQMEADKAVAAALNISVTHAVLLRRVNDNRPGAPSAVLTNPEKIIGDQAARVLKFWWHLDRLTPEQWAAASAAREATWGSAWDSAREDAWDSAREATWEAARDIAWDSTREATWEATLYAITSPSWATNEIQGSEKLKTFFFLPLFGFATPADLDALPLGASHD